MDKLVDDDVRGSEIAKRQPLMGVTITASTTTRFYFGPFGPGERVEDLHVHLDTTATPAAGESLTLDVRVFAMKPKDDATAFANGRELWRGAKPMLPVISREWWLSLLFEAKDEFWLGLEFTEANGDTFTGFLAICGGSRYADR